MSEKVLRLEDVTVQWSYDKSDPNKMINGKLAPRGQSITISLGEVTGKRAEEFEQFIEDTKTLVKKKCKALGKRVDVLCQSVKEIDGKYTLSGKTELGFEFKLTTFFDGVEKVRSTPIIVQDGVEKDNIFPFKADVVDVEYVLNPSEFGGTYHLTPILKTVIIKQVGKNRGTGSSSKNTIDISEIYTDVATGGVKEDVKKDKTDAPQPKAKAKPVDDEDDGVASVDDIGLLD